MFESTMKEVFKNFLLAVNKYRRMICNYIYYSKAKNLIK